MNTPAPIADEKSAVPNIAGRKLAYLLSCYPAVSHTFFLNEVGELRKLGFTIDVASINSPDLPPDGVTEREAGEIKATFYIKTMKRTRVLLLLLKILLSEPLVALRGLRAALRLDPWSLGASGYALLYLAEALLLGDWLRRRGLRHLHIHFGGAVATVGMLASEAWGFPYSLMIHGPDEFSDTERSYLRAKVEAAQFVFCISNYCRSQVMRVCDPAHWNKLEILRLGVDPEVFFPDRSLRDGSRDGSGDGSSTEIICVGRLVPTKGQLVLAQAVSDLLRRGHSLRLRLIGDGPGRTQLEEYVQEQKLGSSIILEGARGHEATRRLLGSADIFVLPSFAEGVPVALMEAMAMEIPCISTFVGGIPELIRDGLDGLLVPASSHRVLAAAIERLIANPELRQELGAAGRRRVLEFYDLQRNVRALAAALDCRL